MILNQLKSLFDKGGKGGKHRVVTLADNLIPTLRQQISLVKHYLEADLHNPEFAGVWLPHRYRIKNQSANKTIGWQYLFPSARLSRDPESNLMRRHHIEGSSVQRAVRDAARKALIDKIVTPHTLRHFLKMRPCIFPFGPSFGCSNLVPDKFVRPIFYNQVQIFAPYKTS